VETYHFNKRLAGQNREQTREAADLADRAEAALAVRNSLPTTEPRPKHAHDDYDPNY
jgi:hypothetical protein